ncbi:hypothetical protein D3C84_1290450 [compost metagenome]
MLAVRRIVALHHVVHGELGGDRLPSEKLLEHPAITLVLVDQLGAKNVSFQNANLQRHGADT